MPDQADNLRHLVSAHREWREFSLKDSAAKVAKHSVTWDTSLSGGKVKRDRTGEQFQAMACFAGRVACWVLGCRAR
jgi:hypothetical protein